MESLEIGKLQEMEISTLNTMAQSCGLEDTDSLRKDELIKRIIEQVTEQKIPLYGKGVLQILDDRDQNYGFLRSPRSNYFQSDEDIYVSSSQIRLFGLQTGHVVEGLVRPPKKSENKTERYFALLQIEKVNGSPPETVKSRIPFGHLDPIFPV